MSDQLFDSGRSLLTRLAEMEARIRALEGAQQSGVLGSDQTIKGCHDRLDSLLGAGVAAPDGTRITSFNADQVDGHDVTCVFTPLTTPLTSTDFDEDDAFSDVGTPTLIDTSSVFSAPAGIKAALVRLMARDSGSAAGADLYFALCASNSADNWAMAVRPNAVPNDAWVSAMGIVPCDANGDFYYICNASGSNTMDVGLRIYGYWV